jgi:hypothetical protein
MAIGQPTEFELLNPSEEPQNFSLAIPPSLIATADELIEYRRLFPQRRMSAFGMPRLSSHVRFWG